MDVAIVRATCRMMAYEIDRCAEMFYGRLVTLDPDIWRHYGRSSMAAQGDGLIRVLSSLADLLDDLPSLQKQLTLLTRQYGIYGIGDHRYQTAKAALTWTVDRMLEPAAEIQRSAWTDAITLAEALLTGIEPHAD